MPGENLSGCKKKSLAGRINRTVVRLLHDKIGFEEAMHRVRRVRQTKMG